MIENEPDNEVANYDYSDAPEWAIPREWLTAGKYGLDKIPPGPFEEYND